MGLAADVKTVLAADTALMAIFGTQIVTYDDLGRLGLNRESYPSAFDTVSGDLLPILIIRDRDQNSTGMLRDEGEQLTSYLQAVEIVVYQSGFNGYAALDTALARVYVLLHDRNAGLVRLHRRVNVTNKQESMLNYAALQWSVYDGYGISKP